MIVFVCLFLLPAVDLQRFMLVGAVSSTSNADGCESTRKEKSQVPQPPLGVTFKSVATAS